MVESKNLKRIHQFCAADDTAVFVYVLHRHYFAWSRLGTAGRWTPLLHFSSSIPPIQTHTFTI